MSRTLPEVKGKGKLIPPAPTEGMTQEERAKAEAQQRSFERSLAGPSVGKAGLIRDQVEVNKIIAEASRGSKFYENQVRKDKELTEKIQWFQAKRDELMKSAKLDWLAAEAERILVEVEASRDLTQTIVHVDMDAFYASVEVLSDPSLAGKAFGVGQGVLTTASYEARKFGCRSGMAGFVAKKLCPHIILVPCNFDLYIAASKSVREVLLQYDSNLMMASLDEGYLNITPYMNEHNQTAAEVINQLRAEVEAKTKLTISAGIAPNRMLAKICSDKNKPNGQFELEFDRSAITKFMRDLPVRKIPGFGRVTERCLEGLGVETCGDIYTKRVELLAMDHWFGFHGLCKAYLGIVSNIVEPGKREERKSVGCERTFRDKTDDEDILNTLNDIAEELAKDLERLQYAGKTVTVKYKHHTFENKSRAVSVKKYISTKDEILPLAQELLKKELPLRIRLLGIRLSTLKDLTVPEKAGIKNYFTSPPKKKNTTKTKTNAQASGSRQQTPPEAHDDSEIINLAGMEDEVDLDWEDDKMLLRSSQKVAEDDEVVLMDEEELEGREGVSSRASNGKSPPHLLGPICPICSKALGPSTSNQELNEHIDWCLNKDAIRGARDEKPVKRQMRAEDQQMDKKVKLEMEPRKKRDLSLNSQSRETGTKGKTHGKGKKEPPKGSMMEWLSRAG